MGFDPKQKFVPFQHLYQQVKKTDPRLYEALDRIHGSLSSGTETINNISNTVQQIGSAGPFKNTLVLGDLSIRDNVCDEGMFFGPTINQNSTLVRILNILRKPITSDLIVRFKVRYPDNSLHTIGDFTTPAATPVDHVLEWITFDHDTLPDKSALTADVIAGDGSTDNDGISTHFLLWNARGAGQSVVQGITPQGAWVSTTTYAMGDLVTFGGALYVSKLNTNLNHQPDTSPTYWMFVIAGVIGPTGPIGATGPMGATGATGATGPAVLHGFGADFDGGGPNLTAGVTGYTAVPVGGIISAWNLQIIPSGSVTIKIWKRARGASNPTVLDSISVAGLSLIGQAIHSTILTDFTTLTIADGDLIGVNLFSCTGAKQVHFSVEL